MDIARKTAVDALDRVFGKDAYSNITLNALFNENKMSAIDRAFSSALVYGVLDRKITLDFVLSSYLKKGVEKTSLTTLNVMRTALYQIMYMDKVPDSAAVNSAVELIKKSKEKYNAGLINGVLRNILRNGYRLPNGEKVRELSVIYSCPEHIITGLINDYGKETAIALLKKSLETPALNLRVNTVKCDADTLVDLLEKEGVKATFGDTENCLTVKGGMEITNLSSYKNGLFHIEDEACQRAIAKLGLKPEMRFLDTCAAPGGKTFTAAQIMQNSGEAVACDIFPARVNLIKDGAKRLELTNVTAVCCDATDNEKLGLFDAILCDVPCSGFGVIRRKPEIKYKEQSDFAQLENLQEKILFCADKRLKSGGKIMYSTCTLRKSENEGQTKKFLNSHTDYKLIYEHTFMPHIDGTDGFYCAIMEKSR